MISAGAPILAAETANADVKGAGLHRTVVSDVKGLGLPDRPYYPMAV